jgi:hypothetical protein
MIVVACAYFAGKANPKRECYARASPRGKLQSAPAEADALMLGYLSTPATLLGRYGSRFSVKCRCDIIGYKEPERDILICSRAAGNAVSSRPFLGQCPKSLTEKNSNRRFLKPYEGRSPLSLFQQASQETEE